MRNEFRVADYVYFMQDGRWQVGRIKGVDNGHFLFESNGFVSRIDHDDIKQILTNANILSTIGFKADGTNAARFLSDDGLVISAALIGGILSTGLCLVDFTDADKLAYFVENEPNYVIKYNGKVTLDEERLETDYTFVGEVNRLFEALELSEEQRLNVIRTAIELNWI